MYRGYPAVLKNEYQKGTAYYIGFRDTGEFLADFYAHIITEHDLGGYDLPEGVTVHTRQNENWLYTFVENYSDEEQTVELAGEYEDMETGEMVCCPVKVEGFGIRILKKPI